MVGTCSVPLVTYAGDYGRAGGIREDGVDASAASSGHTLMRARRAEGGLRVVRIPMCQRDVNEETVGDGGSDDL